jgi:hypothetical protein
VGVRVLCLANSYKDGGRCIAGIDVETCLWVRPVHRREGGAYRVEELRYDNGAPLEVGDVFSFVPDEPAPSFYHPEDVIAAPDWTFERYATRKDYQIAERLSVTGPQLLGSYGTSIDCPSGPDQKLKSSLAAVSLTAAKLRFQKERGSDGKIRKRARFALRGTSYDLPITDPALLQKLAALDEGEHPPMALGLAGKSLLLTISLAEPWDRNNRCYKLVASIISE